MHFHTIYSHPSVHQAHPPVITPVKPFILPPITKEWTATSITELSKIILKNSKIGQFEDYLSLEIFDWGDRMLKLYSLEADESDEEVDLEEIKFKVTTLVNQLVTNILIDPFTNSALENPVLEGKWTWEASTLVHCKSLISPYLPEPRCPFEKIPFKSYPVVHSFALEMIQWVNKCRAKSPTITPSLSSSFPKPMSSSKEESKSEMKSEHPAKKISPVKSLSPSLSVSSSSVGPSLMGSGVSTSTEVYGMDALEDFISKQGWFNTYNVAGSALKRAQGDRERSKLFEFKAREEKQRRELQEVETREEVARTEQLLEDTRREFTQRLDEAEREYKRGLEIAEESVKEARKEVALLKGQVAVETAKGADLARMVDSLRATIAASASRVEHVIAQAESSRRKRRLC